MQTQYAYLNGSVLPIAEASISPLDIGLLRGYAVFDLLRTVGGRPFLLAEHLRRLRSSAAYLGLGVPATDEEIAAIVDDLLERNGHVEATVRFVLTGGVSSDGMDFDPTAPTFMILTHELHEPPASVYENGVKLLTRQHCREVPEAKTTNYLTMLVNRPMAVAEGAFDLLYLDGDTVTEAASASFYIVKDGIIHAPRAKVLWGTVGTYVLDLVRNTYDVVSRDILLAEALDADEAYLTSTTRGVVPVVRLDDSVIGEGCPGPVTRDLIRRFREAVAGA
jgi:branched-chain amino acid aminotransferase